MRLETKIATLLMLAALALGSCTKKPHTPTEEPQPAEVGFTAASQAVWVKGETDPKTTFPYTDFGVWGIARNTSVASPYILWTSNQLTEVSAPEGTQTNKEETNIVFTPTEAAYWLRDYSYDFLAIAPYNPSGLTNVAFTLKDAAGNTTGKDYMTFTYDMSSKYTSGDYAFDLLGAAAQYKVETGGYSTAQNLMFWHLLSQINISVSFGTGLGGEQIVGEVTAIRLGNVVSSGAFEVKHSTGNEISTVCTPSTDASAKKNLSFSGSSATFHIIPQNVKTMDLAIDFTINKGTASEATYTDFKINLNVPANENDYTPNGKYNWIITIGVRNAITFDIDVTPWTTGTGGTIEM